MTVSPSYTHGRPHNYVLGIRNSELDFDPHDPKKLIQPHSRYPNVVHPDVVRLKLEDTRQYFI